ncbi:MAG: glutathione S-transferase family protein [Caulobacteraceae bacterium]|nr:glutathione S-transferase family protein [Caulobacter sp.]
MADDLVLYTNPMSRGRIARWMLEEVGRPYRTEVLDYAAVKRPEFLAVNPMGKVPALRHGDQTVTEGAAICAYLADAFPDAGLAPPLGDPARAPYFRWLFFASGPLEHAITNANLGVVVPPEKRRMAGYGGDLAPVLDVLESAVDGRRYIAGERFSAADVYVGSQIGFGLRFGTIDARPAFADYFAGLSSRPAYARAAELDDAAMAAMATG